MDPWSCAMILIDLRLATNSLSYTLKQASRSITKTIICQKMYLNDFYYSELTLKGML